MTAACGTVVEMLARAAAERPQRGGLLVPQGGQAGGSCAWQLFSWYEVACHVRVLASGLARRGIGPGDRVALAADNSFEWVLCDLAVQFLQGILVPLHETLSGRQLVQQIQHSGSRLLLAGPSALGKLAGDAPVGVEIISLPAPGDERPDREEDRSVSRNTFLELFASGDEQSAAAIWKAGLTEANPRAPASIVYTSGTSSEPRGVVLSQGNLAANAAGIVADFGHDPHDLRFNSLPFSHAYARMSDLYVSLAGGTTLALGRGRNSFLADAVAIAPTLLVVVPLQLARIRQAATAIRVNENGQEVKSLLGGKVRGFICGGAPLAADLHDFFDRQGTPVYEGYGLTEASPVVALSSPVSRKVGSVGQLVTGTSAKLAEDGELLIRGEQVMSGYWRDETATQQALGDGWLYTGDLAMFDDDGFLYLKGRKCEAIALASGKKVWPVALEDRLAGDPLIEQMMVLGEGMPTLAALVVPRDRNQAEELNSVENRRRFVQHLATRLQDFAAHEQIRRVWLLPEPWTAERDELTPKLTLRRPVILARYADCIRALFREDEQHDDNRTN